MMRNLVLAPLVLFAALSNSVFTQDSRSSSRAVGKPATAPTASAKPAIPVFQPDPALPHIDTLIEMVKAKATVEWFLREKPKPDSKAHPGDVMIAGTTMKQHDAEALFLETNEVRKTVIEAGIESKGGSRVLPLGRFEWEKPAPLLKEGESRTTAVLGVIVAAEKPFGDVKGFRVKGEFYDSEGKRVAEMNHKSWPGSPKNGVFVVVMPAGVALKQCKEFDGFQFKLLEVGPLK